MSKFPATAAADVSASETGRRQESDGAGPDDLSDELLAERYLAGGRTEDSLFARLVRRRRNDVWRVCFSFFGNHQDAEDMTQEVFFTAYRKLAQFGGRSSLRTWLHRIAANTCKNELRRRSRRPRAREGDADFPETLPHPGSSTEEALLLEERHRLLGRALGLLPVEDARLLRLVELEARPYADLATELGLSLSGVKMRVLRARLALQRVYQGLQTAEAEP